MKKPLPHIKGLQMQGRCGITMLMDFPVAIIHGFSLQVRTRGIQTLRHHIGCVDKSSLVLFTDNVKSHTKIDGVTIIGDVYNANSENQVYVYTGRAPDSIIKPEVDMDFGDELRYRPKDWDVPISELSDFPGCCAFSASQVDSGVYIGEGAVKSLAKYLECNYDGYYEDDYHENHILFYWHNKNTKNLDALGTVGLFHTGRRVLAINVVESCDCD